VNNQEVGRAAQELLNSAKLRLTGTQRAALGRAIQPDATQKEVDVARAIIGTIKRQFKLP